MAKLRYDDFVARVNADPAKAQDTTLVSGFVGKGDADGRVRIYPDVSLSSWHDVAEDDIVHSVPLPVESSPLGGSHVWLKAGAEVKRGGSAQPAAAHGGGAAAFPTALNQSCGIACTVAPTSCVCPPPCTIGTTLCPTVNDQTCQPPCPPPPCTLASTFCPTVNGQTCPAPCPPAQPINAPYTIYPHLTCGFVCHTQQDCGGGGGTQAAFNCPQPTMSGHTCPNGDCTFFGCITQLATCAACTGFTCPTHSGHTCPNGDCTFFGCPTRVHPCPQVGNAQAAAMMPTPTATFYHTCGTHCQQGGTLPFSLQHSCGIACTYVACPVPTANCTLPSVTCPITPARTGIFNPLGR
ncbi:MAG TPA: hypothetical protein VGU66_04290 [Candidatus Elarobacter sp.]|nr:hypothetical protein [Candidatus Elarobacter sp.]